MKKKHNFKYGLNPYLKFCDRIVHVYVFSQYGQLNVSCNFSIDVWDEKVAL